MIFSSLLFIFAYSLLMYCVSKMPGVVLVFLLLFPSINNIILDRLGFVNYRYFFGLLVLAIFVFKNIKPKIFSQNLGSILKSKIFIGVILILLGMFVGFLDGGLSSLGYSIVGKFLMPIFIMFLIGALFINSREILEQMSYGIIIFGAIFYVVIYLLVDLSVIIESDRWSIGETGFFNAITLARMCGMILITSVLYSIYTKFKVFIYVNHNIKTSHWI